MNPYAKGLGSEVYAQSAPTSAGKVATHFNSPYMRAISQNLMTAIYGSPQDDLTRQRIEQSKLAMEQTRAQMEQAAGEQQARDELTAAWLGDDANFDKNGLTQQGRRALTGLAIQTGAPIPSVWGDTGEHWSKTQLQKSDQDWRADNREDIQLHEIAQANTRHSQNIFMTGLEHDYAKELADIRGQQSIDEILTRHENDVFLADLNNKFEGEQNAIDRTLDATTTALDYTENMQVTPEQLGSVFEVLGITKGEDMLQNLSEATPYPKSSSTKPGTLVPWERIRNFAYAELIAQGLSKADANSKSSEIATQAVSLQDQNPNLSEMQATQQIMSNAPKTPSGSNPSNVFTTESGLKIEPLN